MNKNKQQGFSIIESMITISLGLIVTSALMGTFLSSKQNYRLQDASSQMQNNIRFIKFLMHNEIRMSGFQGCLSNHQPNIVAVQTGLTFATNDIIKGYEASASSWSPELPTNLKNQVKAGTDVITIKRAASQYQNLNANMLASSDNLTIAQALPNFKTNDLAFITDCESTDIFKATVSSNGLSIQHKLPENNSANLSKSYQTDAKIMRYENKHFYIGDTGRTNNSGNTIYALYSMDMSGNAVEMMAGVENLQLTFGVDQTGDGSINHYDNAKKVNDDQQWDRVISVRAQVLMNSIDNVLDKSQSYTFNGVTTANPGDRLLRKHTTSVIHLRNVGL